MNQFLCALCVLCGLNLIAAPLQWTCDWPEAKSQTFSLYQGETATFEPTFRVNGRTVTNATIEAVWYQTNGMGNAWWKLDGATFAPSNDVGAAAYRFFVEAKTSDDILYRANGALRMLPSPGFTPNTIELPVARLDFAAVDVLNPPWTDPDYSTNNTALVDTIEATAPAPGNYAAVSNAAMNAFTQYAEYDGTQSYGSGELCSFQGRLYRCTSDFTTHGAFDPQDWQPVDVISDLLDGAGLLQVGSAMASDMAWSLLDEDGVQWTFEEIYDPATNAIEIARAATATNALQDAAISGKQDNLPYPTNSIPYAAISGKPTLATVATSGSYNDLSNKPTIPTVPTNVSSFNNDAGYLTGYTETDPTIKSWAKANTKPTYTASEVGAATAEDVYRIVAGTNVLLIVTNYNSATHAPAMKLQHLDPGSGQYVTYWDEQRRHGMTLTNAMDYTDAAIETRAAPRAWSGTTSGLGSEAPAGVTWISTPETVIAGGYEYEKVVTTAGAVWVLSSNGLTTGATTNSFFRVSATDGTELFSIEKTDSYLIGVNADGITKSGNTVTIPLNVVANAHPYIRATTNLVDAVWVKEDENGFTCPWATVSWSGTTGAYVATVTCSQPQAFFYFEYMVEGVAKIKNSAKTEMTGGIIFNGTTYMPTVSGNELKFIAQ